MEDVIQALRKIGQIPGANVDRNFGQSYEALFNQLSQLYLRVGKKVGKSDVDDFIKWCQDEIEKLELRVKPHKLPSDYRFFLEYCGGFIIEKDEYNLIFNGVGPMIYVWYTYIMGDEVYKDLPEKGLIDIASLTILNGNNGHYPIISFLLDISGVVKKNSVLGVGSMIEEPINLDEIFRNFQQYPDVAKISANSFTEWLEKIAQTNGTLGYL